MIAAARGFLIWVGDSALRGFSAVGEMNHLFWQTVYWVFVGPSYPELAGISIAPFDTPTASGSP